MNRLPNANIYNTLKTIKSKLKLLYNEYKTKYENEKDTEKKKKLKDNILEIVKEYNQVNAFLKKYYNLFESLSTCDSTLRSKIISDIDNLEKEIVDYYGINKEEEKSESVTKDTTNESKASNVQTNTKESSPIKKGEKYRVTDIIKASPTGVRSAVDFALAAVLAYFSLSSIFTILSIPLASTGIIDGLLTAIAPLIAGTASFFGAKGTYKLGKRNYQKAKDIATNPKKK